MNASFTRCNLINSVDGLGKGLAKHGPHRGRFELTLCNQINSVDDLSKGPAKLTGLTEVNLSFARCNQTSSGDEIG